MISKNSSRPIKHKIIQDIDYLTPKNATYKKRTSHSKTNSNVPIVTNNKGPWTEQEDKKLIELVEKFGAEKWAYISKYFTDRIGKQCRERWFNHLNPSVNKTSWSEEEEWILFIQHQKLGNKWSQLCKFLPGRTDNTIKNHWNSTMQKKMTQFEKDYEEKIKDKNEDEIIKIQNDILDKCKVKVEKNNEIFFDEKIKNYEKFKNTSLENKTGILQLKKILLLRTHSKKTKRRGRKRKNINLSEEEIINSMPKNKNKYIKKSISKSVSKKIKKNLSKKLKMYKSPKIKKSKTEEIENKNNNIIPLKEEEIEEEINKKDEYSLMNEPNPNNSYSNGIKETPTFKMNKYINIQNRLDNINENEGDDKNNKENKIFFSVLRNETNILNNSNSKSNLDSHQRTNCESTDIKNNNNSTKNIINKLINNNFQNINNVINNKNINMNLNMNINMNMNMNMHNNIPSPSEQKSNNSGSSSGLKDIRLSTPIKLCQTSSIAGGAYKPFHKNEGGAFNCIGTDNALEKSAFNKQVIIDTPFPYSTIKTHLCFTSSIKKPVKIISYDNNNQEIHSGGSGNKNNNNNININNYYQNIENMTPNKVIEFSGSGSSGGLRFKNMGYSSSKKPECLNLNSSGRILNNPFNDFTPNKNTTPFKISNANLDKMFFSNINSKVKS